MDEQQPPTLPPLPTASGKLVVLGFVATGALVLLLVIGLRRSLQPTIQQIQQEVLPTLSAPLQVDCALADGTRQRLVRGGSCPVGAVLDLSIGTPGHGTSAVHYALLAPDVARPGQLAAGRHVSQALAGPAGPRFIGLVLSGNVLLPGELESALNETDLTTLDARVDALERYVKRGISEGRHVRAEVFPFQVVDP